MTQDLLPKETIKVADYLFTRLHQLGVRSVFGVPGDYNLRLLDFVGPSGLHWVGNCNELNAAYAADGYARINGLAALITTFGVGELSAVNGIAGAYAEKAPVIHIVGTPPRSLQSSRALVHHTFADGDYHRFAAMSSHITVAQANLVDPRTTPAQIDWVLEQALIHSRPAYIALPDDMVDVIVSASNLVSKNIIVPTSPGADHESLVLSQVRERIYSAQRPLILVDGESRTFGVLDQIETLVRTTGWPTWTTVFGKSLVNEQLPNVYGNYAGGFGDKEWKAYFDSADLVIDIGPHHSSTNSQTFTTLPNPAVSIAISSNEVQIGSDVYRDISRSFLSQLLQSLDWIRVPKAVGPPKPSIAIDELNSGDPITQNHFYRVVNPLIREGDLVLTETGTASHGGRNFTLPPNVRLFGAVTWLSIGYMLPATLGAGIAQRELNFGTKSRAILFIGDGSLQMSVQEISTIIREDLDVIIFIINNEGYTIERAIHGRKQTYNDIAPWRHAQALDFFGADQSHVARNYFKARTWAQLEAVLKDGNIQEGSGVRIVEVFMGREDVQGALLQLLERQIEKE
jgi:pyruvate decarboxylase